MGVFVQPKNSLFFRVFFFIFFPLFLLPHLQSRRHMLTHMKSQTVQVPRTDRRLRFLGNAGVALPRDEGADGSVSAVERGGGGKRTKNVAIKKTSHVTLF